MVLINYKLRIKLINREIAHFRKFEDKEGFYGELIFELKEKLFLYQREGNAAGPLIYREDGMFTDYALRQGYIEMDKVVLSDKTLYKFICFENNHFNLRFKNMYTEDSLFFNRWEYKRAAKAFKQITLI